MPADAARHAYVRYTRVFPDLASLGTGAPPSAWLAAVLEVDPTAFDAVVATGMSVEGGNMNGQLNFEQTTLIQALYARRAELDPTFVNPYTQPLPPMREQRRTGIIVQL